MSVSRKLDAVVRRCLLKWYAGFALAWVVCGGRFPMAHAQSPAPDSRTPTLTSESSLVLVPALVRTRAGELVYTLDAKDFVLTDDGVEQKVRLEADTGGEPLALVVLVEAGAAMKSAGWHPQMRDAVDRLSTLPTMVDAMAGAVPRRIAVVGFDSGPELLQDFTSNIDLVTDSIHELSTVIDGDGGGAILDGLGFALELLRKQPPQYRRAILLLSETNDRGSKLTLDDAVRAVSDTNTAIYSIAYSTGNTDASGYAHRELPTKHGRCKDEEQLCAWLAELEHSSSKTERISGNVLDLLINGIGLENTVPGPANGCMGKPEPGSGATENRLVRAYDCLGQLLPPLTLAKVAAIAASENMRRNIPQTVARMTGGEYFALSDAKSLEASLQAISNHMPNRYVLSFQPQSPHEGMHVLALRLRDYPELEVTARSRYWADVAGAP